MSQPKCAWMTTSLLVLVFLVLTAPTARAQNFTFTSAAFPQVFASSVAWGDYDNDGFLDFAIIGSRDSVADTTLQVNLSVAKIYHNNGNGTFTENTQVKLMPVCIGTAVWGDYDNDGYLDLLYGGVDTLNNQVTKLYHNNGNGTFTENTLTAFHSSSYGSVAWGDFNNDGYLDILICGVDLGPAEETAKLYRNNKNGTFTEVTTAVFQGVNGLARISFGDYDNDGFPDVLLCGRTTRDWSNPQSVTKLYHNNKGNGTFTEDTNAHFVNVAHGTALFGDFNNDGYLDVLVTGLVGPAIGPPGFVQRDTAVVYLNSAGNGRFTPVTQPMGSVGPVQSFAALGDYDGDGRLDVLLNGYGSAPGLFKGNGNGTFTSQSAPIPETAFGTVAWGDFNGDGYFDAAVSGTTSTNPSHDTTLILRNIGPGTSSSYTANTAPAAPTGLKAVPKDSSVTLSWNRPGDNKTPTLSLSYALRVGRTSGAFDVVSPLAAANGKRRVAALGAQMLDTSWTLQGLSAGTYYWSVQAIDNGYAGSAFATEGSFTIGAPPPPSTQVSPKSLTFDSVLVFQSKRDSVKLKNTGASALKITATHTGDTAFAYTPDSANVNAGDSVYFKVTFKPTAVKAYAGTLFLANSGGKVDTVAVTGNGKVMTLTQVRNAAAGSTVSFQATVSRARGRSVYVQDTAAGLTIFQSSGALFDSVAHGYIQRADRVIFSGKTTLFNNLLEISGAASLTGFTRVSRGDTATIRPVALSLSQLRLAPPEKYESR
ncbi:MAG TPA: FG-GAP-like repeat-containing protein, partial [Bacteroidota bacterium]